MKCPACDEKFRDPGTELITCPHCDARWWSDEAKNSVKTFKDLVRGMKLPDYKRYKNKHSAYIVLLKGVPELRGQPGCYVGSTGQPVEERFLKHLRGGRTANNKVTKYGKALLRHLYEGPKPITKSKSLRKERLLSKHLESLGVKVYGDRGRPIRIARKK